MGVSGSLTSGSLLALQPRTRFFLLLLPRLLAGRCSAARLTGYALALIESGNQRLGAWCWDRAIRRCRYDETACEALLDQCIRAGHHEAAVTLANAFYDASGLAPAAAVRLTGKLVLSGAFGAALRIYDTVLGLCGEDLGARSPAPAWGQPVSAHQLRSMIARHAEFGSDGTAHSLDVHCHLARLSFTFAAFDTSAKLFERAGEHGSPLAEDRIAHTYALLRSDAVDRVPRQIEDLGASRELARSADWQILLASVLFARGAAGGAAAAVERALRAKLENHPDVEEVVSDGHRIISYIKGCPQALTFGDGTATRATAHDERGIRKVFVCGNGWSGSGALYDALTDYDCLAEAPETPRDRYINECTSNEMMFVQGPGGLGWMWRTARQTHELSRRDLWELFRCHVLGGGAIGHSEHKTARTASTLLTRYGSRYTAIFRRAYQALAALPQDASIADLRSLLAQTTECLTALLTGASEEDCVIFNNAVFGPNVDMLEIFRNFRAAVVARDPLDQYADRRAQDLKHWMTPGRFVSFYRASRKAFHTRREEMRREHAREVREVEFERFVLDEPYRQSVIDWLLGARNAPRVRRRFQPERSAKNIGIYAELLSPTERLVIARKLKQWRRS